MQTSKNYVYRILAILISLVFLYLLFYFVFGKSSQKSANKSVVMQDLALMTKSIAISQNDTGNYGIVTEVLPFTGCSIANSFLDNDEVKKILSRLESVNCVSDGNQGQIKSWAISAKISDGVYWCVDESGNRTETANPVTVSSCK